MGLIGFEEVYLQQCRSWHCRLGMQYETVEWYLDQVEDPLRSRPQTMSLLLKIVQPSEIYR